MISGIIIKCMLSAIGGLIVGVVVTYKTVSNFYEEIIDEEINEAVEDYIKSGKAVAKGFEDGLSDINEEISEKFSRENVVDYHEMKKTLGYYQDKDLDKHMAEREFPEDETEDPTEELSNGYPYVIDSEEFSNGHPEYDHITLTFNREDDILYEENGDVITNERYVVGDAIDYIRKNDMYLGSNPIDVLYVRNRNISCDYEIIVL